MNKKFKKVFSGLMISATLASNFAFAVETNYIPGDINQDNKITKEDAIGIAEKVFNGTVSEDDVSRLDYNSDGKVDIKDSQDIMRNVSEDFTLGDINEDGKVDIKDSQDLMKIVNKNFILGDINEDGKITVDDLKKLNAYVMKQGKLTTEEKIYADLNSDNIINVGDLLILNKKLRAIELGNVKKGDLDKNGIIDSNDASLALYLYKTGECTDEQIKIGDMDGNGLIDSNDASKILEIYKTGN